MNGQQNQQHGKQHHPVDPVANRPVHNSSSSSVRDTIGLKSSEILNWLNAYFNAKVNMNLRNILGDTDGTLGFQSFFGHNFGKNWLNIIGSFNRRIRRLSNDTYI
jgi:hypothetical protein